MKHSTLLKTRAGALLLAGLSAATILLGGCSDLKYADPNPKQRFVFPGEQPPMAQTPAPLAQAPAVAVPGAPAPAPAPPPGTNLLPKDASVSNPDRVGFIRIGDSISVAFADLPPAVVIQESRMRIGEDGKITLHLNQTVHAAGKTARQLEQEIRSLYVPKYYNYMTVTVKSDERWYFVGGEVKNANRQVYWGPITVLRAIDTAGGFTDFASRSDIELTRQDGKKIKINYRKALKDPKLDPEVYPNDQIYVGKRTF
jgi:protein involved in polysaccharide export with SLBB domain